MRLMVFEVEHSTNFRDAFVKFMELRDIRTTFHYVADDKKIDKFDKEMNRAIFKPLKDICRFISYKEVEDAYNGIARKSYLL